MSTLEKHRCGFHRHLWSLGCAIQSDGAAPPSRPSTIEIMHYREGDLKLDVWTVGQRLVEFQTQHDILPYHPSVPLWFSSQGRVLTAVSASGH